MLESLLEPLLKPLLKLTRAPTRAVSGTLKPTLRSAPAPVTNFEPLTVVVASTFDELVFGDGLDVLLLITASWCDGCEDLDAQLRSVANLDGTPCARRRLDAPWRAS